MPMMQAPVIQAVQKLLQEHGVEKRVDERLGDYVARGLNATPAQAERLLEALHEGKTIEEAQAEAGIPPGGASAGLLTAIGRTVGSVLGTLAGLTSKSPG
jgi:hypothetical protein